MDGNKHFRIVLSNFQHFRPVLWVHSYLTLIFRSCVWRLGGLDLRKAWRDLLIFRGVAWHRSSRFLTASLSNHPNRRGDIRRVKNFGQRNESVTNKESLAHVNKLIFSMPKSCHLRLGLLYSCLLHIIWFWWSILRDGYTPWFTYCSPLSENYSHSSQLLQNTA